MGRIGAPGILDDKKDSVFCPQGYRGFASDVAATSKGCLRGLPWDDQDEEGCPFSLESAEPQRPS